jgi:hypothetical protein
MPIGPQNRGAPIKSSRMENALAAASDGHALERRLDPTDLRQPLVFLNTRTPHRFTGIFRFDDAMLRCVELVDKWDSSVRRGDDVPVEKAYCAHLRTHGGELEVADGRADPRVPWMADSPVVSYCGVAIEAADGTPWGALCHFDLGRCEATTSDVALMTLAAKVFASRLCGEEMRGPA